MTKGEFLKKLLIDGAAHWDFMQEAANDDPECQAPESFSFEQMMATFIDMADAHYHGIALEQDAAAEAARKRLANPAR